MRSETVSSSVFPVLPEHRRNVLAWRIPAASTRGAVAAACGNRQIERAFRVGRSLNDFVVVLQKHDFCVWNAAAERIDYFSMQTAIGLTLCKSRQTTSARSVAAQKVLQKR